MSDDLLKSEHLGAQSLTEKAVGRLRMSLYGLVNLPTSIVGLPIALYIPAFYSQNLGLSLALVGTLIALSRLTDVVTDPAIGIASDRWLTRFGRRKPWMAFGMPLKLLALWTSSAMEWSNS